MKNFSTIYTIADQFYWIALLKVAPHNQYIIEAQLPKILEYESKRCEDRKKICGYIGPYTVFGQYDLLFGLSTKDITDGDRYFYAILDYFNRDKDNVIIKDYHKFLSFNWETNLLECKGLPCIAYSMIKYKYKNTAVSKKMLTSFKLLQELIDHIKSETKNYKDINEDRCHLSVENFGTMAWYECLLFFYGHNLDLLYKADEFLRRNNKIAAVNTTLLLDANNKWTEKIVTGNAKYYLITQLARDPIFDDSILVDIASESNPKPLFQSSTNHKTISLEINPSTDIDNHFSKIKNLPDIKYTKSFFSKRYDISSINNKNQNKNINLVVSVEEPIYDEIDKNYKTILKSSISKRKLLALKTQVEMILNVPTLRDVLPRNIIKSLDFLMTENFDDSSIQHYISEFTSAISERLSGAQLDTLIGKDIGFIERHGSYQRLLFACESLIIFCFNLYCRLMVPELKNRKPVIFIFFDYGARLSPEMPPQSVVLRSFSNTPIVIRLKMLKYKPWLWCTGLRELAKILYIYDTKKAVLELISEDPEVEIYSNNFLRHFYIKENYRRIIAEEIGLFNKEGINKYGIYHHKYEELEIIYQSLKIDRKWISDKISMTQIKNVQESIRKGHIFFKMNEELFLAFINAYQLMSRKEQSDPRCFFSFTLSLFWNHPTILESTDAR